MKIKTIEQVRAEFDQAGMTYAEWCRKNNIPQQVVKDLLRGQLKGRYGQAHNAAVLLGLKLGTVNNNQQKEAS